MNAMAAVVCELKVSVKVPTVAVHVAVCTSSVWVAEHVAGSGEMEPSEYASMLVAATDKGSLVGKRLGKLEDEDKLYKSMEEVKDYAACTVPMLNAMRAVQPPESVGDTSTSDTFDGLEYHVGDDILAYHTARGKRSLTWKRPASSGTRRRS